MKKSEIYSNAMCCVIEDRQLNTVAKMEIIEQLVKDKQLAEWSEKHKEEAHETV